jgi:hypothetical protein
MGHSESSAAPAAITRSADLFAAVGQLRDIDYVASATHFGPSSDAQTAVELLHKVHALQERLDLAWVGATVAQIFLQRPWLRSLDVEVAAEAIQNDAGGSCISHSLRFDNAVPVPGARWPLDMALQDGPFDARAAAESLAITFEDCAYDFAAPFLLPNVVGTTTLHLDRDQLAPLLGHGAPVSGLDVARWLWPDHEVVRALCANTGDGTSGNLGR